MEKKSAEKRISAPHMISSLVQTKSWTKGSSQEPGIELPAVVTGDSGASSFEITLRPESYKIILGRNILFSTSFILIVFLLCIGKTLITKGWQSIIDMFVDQSIYGLILCGLAFGVTLGLVGSVWNKLLVALGNRNKNTGKIFASPDNLLLPLFTFLDGEVPWSTNLMYSGSGVLRTPARLWHNIHTIQANELRSWDLDRWRSRGLTGKTALQIYFDSGVKATILISLLTKSEATKLFLAIEAYADPAKLSSEVIEIKQALFTDVDLFSDSASTWEANLALNYSTTNFRTLPFNHTLQNGRYQIITQIGGAGMSAVYLAKKETGEKVVVKETIIPIEGERASIEKTKELVERESKILSKIIHPQIANIFDYFIEQNRIYLVLEYIPGATLRQIVHKHGPIQPVEVLNLTEQLAEILVYLHGQNPPLLHRDISPDNVILRDDNKLVLIDFGAANEFIEKATSTFIGKQSYISPEQFRGKAEPRSDIYSLGGTIFFLLTGIDPVPLSQSYPKDFNESVYCDLDSFVASCTGQELIDRPASAQAVLAQVRELINDRNKKHEDNKGL